MNELLTYLVAPVAQVAIVMGLAEIAKKAGLCPKYIPILDVVLGLVCGFVVYTVYMNMLPVEGIILGVAIGLSACGLFSGIKNTIEE
jgi:hypothetical protein